VFKYCFIFIVLGYDTSTLGTLEPLSHMSVPSMLPGVEVSCPKTINIPEALKSLYRSPGYKKNQLVSSVFYANRKSKMAATTGHSINTGQYGDNAEIYSSLKLLH
jgi:hypothetical protein